MSGDQLRGQQLIVGGLTASAAIAAGAGVVDGTLRPMRLVVGVTVSAATLATVNMFSPDLAGGMAILVLTTTVFVYGGPLFDAIAISLGKAPAGHRGPTVKSPAIPEGSVSI